MLDFVYFPVSALLWCWHQLSALAFGPATGITWLIAVFALVVTVRALLVRTALRQARSQAVLRTLQPRIDSIRRTHKDDPLAQTTEIRRLHREHGVRLFAGFGPMIGQAFVFLGLFHVLRSFDRTGAFAVGPFTATSTPLSPEVNAATANYFFGADEVRAFLDARLFGAPLSATLFGTGASAAVFVVALVVIAALATHCTARLTPLAADNPTASVMRTLSLWVFPAGALVSGAILPIVVLVYFATNALWTLCQQYLLRRAFIPEVAAPDAAPRQRKAG
ncbi:membrane protein insertase YidC [Nocardia sp. JW2]|uniref:membrane protein insertase YidC n=1 Tax=Nocardia sp. JW2 TaxID=3450738 RepID=UPI003F421E5A